MPQSAIDDGEPAGSAEFAFEDWASSCKLSKKTVQLLRKEELTVMEAIESLTSDEIQGLSLPLGQAKLLQLGVQRLQTPAVDNRATAPAAPGTARVPGQTGVAPADSQPPPGCSGMVTAATLNCDREISTILENMQDVPGDALWNLDGAGSATIDRPQGKPLVIGDFVSRATEGTVDTSEQRLFSQGGSQVILRSCRQKPLPEQVSLAQWISANARILQRLIANGELSSKGIVDYLEYTSDFGDYAQVCEKESLMIYDHEYRLKQARKKTQWGVEDVHLANFYLQRKNRHPGTQTSKTNNSWNRQPSTPPRSRDSAGGEICRTFNGSGCQRSFCKYSHVCAICKDGTHSQTAHMGDGQQSSH